MCQPKKWWIGLLPLLALWLATLWWKTAPIEADLQARASTQIASEKASEPPSGWAEVAVAGRDVTVSGRAPAEGLQVRAADAADRVFGVRLVNGAASLLEEQKPFTWAAARDGGKLTLTGFVAPDDSREKIIAAAKAAFPGIAIDDQMKVARGAPSAAAAMAAYGLGQLAKLEKGTASYSNQAYSITGTAPTSEIYAATLAAVKSLPNAMTLAKAEIIPPTLKPYLWSAERKANDVTLAGYVPSDAVRTSLVDAAKQAFSGATITDKMQIALGAPQNFAEAALAGLGQLATLVEGKAALSDLAFSLTGRSSSAGLNTASLLESLRGKLPAGIIPQVSVESPAPPPPPPPPPPSLPTARPFVWSASKLADGLNANGFAPSETALKNNAAAVQALVPAAKFVNELRVAQGLPDSVDFNAATQFALSQLNVLRTGAARISDNKISVTGEAPNLTIYQSVLTALNGALPGGLAKDQVAITVAPYAWGMTLADDVVTLTGLVPDERSRQELLASVAKALPKARIVDQLGIAAGAPSCFAALTSASINHAGNLDSGAVQFDGTALRVSGQAASTAIAEQIKSALAAGWPNCARGMADITIRPAVSIPPPDLPPVPPLAAPAPKPAVAAPPVNQCPVLIRSALEKDRILFDTAKATIRAESQKVLKDIADVLNACKGAQFEVAAHTDSDGDPAMNQDLSERRAAAVVEYLTEKLNVAKGQLTSKGYGAARPIAPNTTAEGKQQNRRVEFNLAN